MKSIKKKKYRTVHVTPKEKHNLALAKLSLIKRLLVSNLTTHYYGM